MFHLIKPRFFLISNSHTRSFKSLKKLNKYCNSKMPASTNFLSGEFHVVEMDVNIVGKICARDYTWNDIDITGEWVPVDG